MASPSSTFHQPASLQMPPQPPTKENKDPPSTVMMVPTQGRGVETAPATRSEQRQRNKAALFGFGIAEIVIGGLSIVLTIVPLSITRREYRFNSYNYYYYYTFYGPYVFTGFTYAAPGIWGGIFVIVTGILAVRIKFNPTRCMYISNMIMAIITACVTFSSTIISGIAAASAYSSTLIAVHVIITLLNFVSMIITIAHAAFCCRGVCCKQDSTSIPPIRYIPTQSSVMYPSQPQYVQGPNGQVMLAYVQQVPAQGYSQSHTPIQVANPPPPINISPPEMMQILPYPDWNVNADETRTRSADVPNV